MIDGFDVADVVVVGVVDADGAEVCAGRDGVDVVAAAEIVI